MRIQLTGCRDDYLDYRKGSGDTVEIYDILVTSDRRAGIGRRMVDHLFRVVIPDGYPRARLVWAITRADNFIAQQFYESMRFRVVGVLRNFYRDDEDVLRDTVDAIMYGKDVHV